MASQSWGPLNMQVLKSPNYIIINLKMKVKQTVIDNLKNLIASMYPYILIKK